MDAPPDYCEKSTITEAWAIVLGLPGALDKNSGPILAHLAEDAIEGLTERPAPLAFSVSPPGLTPPFWNQQFAWDSDRYAARFGHRYLSVHFVRRDEGTRYETYAKTMEPWIRKWLDL